LGEEDWEVWAAMEDLYYSGKTKTIGVSNITASQLALLCEQANVKPMMVQNRCFAVLGWDKAVREICRKHNLIYQGFSLLTANTEFLAAPEMRNIAQRLVASPAQVVFRFAIQTDMLPLTGTTSPQHMREDLQSEQLALSMDEIRDIETIAL
jgi:diketogulonate reductase-like aldo/keto reductase